LIKKIVAEIDPCARYPVYGQANERMHRAKVGYRRRADVFWRCCYALCVIYCSQRRRPVVLTNARQRK